MPNIDRERAIFILNRYCKRSFYRVKNIKGYIRAVKKRLDDAGIKGVPETPEKFLEFCLELGLYQNKKERKGIK